MAAVDAVLGGLPVGARVLVPTDAYTGTRGLLADAAARGRLRAVPIDMTDTAEVLARLVEADLVWVESPLNPLLGLVDLPRVLAGARFAGVPAVVDNTLATPVLQRPLDLGATAVVHSATKFIGGHSDLLLGVVATRDHDLLARLEQTRSMRGAVPGTQEAWLALRGLRTLPLRVERGQTTARLISARLEDSEAVTRVRYPGLATHPGHDLVATQMAGPGAVLSFELADRVAAEAMVSRLRLIVSGTSFGGVETTIDRRQRWPGEERIPAGLLRVSFGIEDAEDIWADLTQALEG
jgi:cystathionine gamma-synthase